MILVVGSVAFDHVRTPAGEAPEALGGAATYFSTAASILDRPIRLVGVVGEDFPEDLVRGLNERGIETDGLERVPGETFRWKGYYEGDMGTAYTEETCLNVFETFSPRIPEEWRKTEYVFLANIDPEIQLSVLDQVERPRMTALDTMNFWISSKKDALLEAMKRTNVFVLNEGEARDLAGTSNLIKAADEILSMGPDVVMIKKGANGSLIASGGRYGQIPAYPLKNLVDPTGAGDSFGGGFMGAMASAGKDHTDFDAVMRAAGYGSVIASFNCESFSMENLSRVTVEDVEERLSELRGSAAF